MAKRYSGRVVVNVVYRDQGDYKYTVSKGGRTLDSGFVREPASGFGRGVSSDSPSAYDQTARAALSFALNDRKVDESDIDDGPDGAVVSRSAPGRVKKMSVRRAANPTMPRRRRRTSR